MADPHFTVANSGGTNADTLNATPDIIAAITRIAISVDGELGSEGVEAALDQAFELLDDSNPSVSDLEPLADAVGADLSDLGDGSDAGGDGGGDTAAATASNNVSLTSNTRSVARAHGLPTDWHALDGIDLPPSLADATLDDRGLAAAINTANGWDPAEGEGVPPRRVANVRDKDLDGEPGASLSALADDGEDVGLNSDLDAEHSLPVSTVKNRVTRHLSKTGRDAGLNSRDSFGAGLEDLDGE